MSQIHPTAVIDPGASIGSNVQIGPYCVIGKSVRIEDDVSLKAHVCIEGHTTIGQGTEIFPGACIGLKTQDLKYRGETTYVEIGKKCQIRECVTINSSCGEGTAVKVGDSCLIMAYCHIAHNCVLEDQVIMVNNATLAGHIHVGKGAVIGGLSAVHQFSNIGCYSFIGGMSRITHDVLPYSLVAGSPAKVGGLNLVGLKRRGVPLFVRNALSRAFRFIYREGLALQEALYQIELAVEDLPEVRQMVSFCRETKRGLIGMQGVTADPLECDVEEEKDPTFV
jgi:UDP-N-acetylglucosamine acyltransferase